MMFAAAMTGNPFRDDTARKNYVLVCVAVFFLFTTTSTLTVLSVVLSNLRYAPADIGYILASPIVPVLVSLLVAGRVVQGIGVLLTMLLGAGLTVAGFVAFEVGISSLAGAVVCRSVIGLGFGLLFSSSTVCVRDLLTGPSTTYFFGIFSALVPLPNAFAPSLGEWYLQHFGIDNFFLWLALPAIIGSLVLMYLFIQQSSAQSTTIGPLYTSYGRTLKRREFLLPALGILAVGLIWGFAVAYAALYLVGRNIPVGSFFLPLSLALFGSRFSLLAYLQCLDRSRLVTLAFTGMSLAYGLLLMGKNVAVCALAGLVFGLGYSLAFPTLSVWASDEFGVAERPIVMSLFNAFFHAGIFALPLVLGLFSGISLSLLLVSLTVLGGGLALGFYIVGKRFSTGRTR